MGEKTYFPKNRLRHMRELRGWTQKEVAEMLDLPDTRTLRRWESGDVAPSFRYRARLCEIFEVGPEVLGLLLTEKGEAVLTHPSVSGHTPHVTLTTSSKLQLLMPLNTSSTSFDHWNRQRLLEKVYVFWIKQVFERSLQGRVPVTLELQEQLDAVSSPWGQAFALSPQSVHPGTPILQIYDDACGELLLLGEARSGKTTLLIELTRELLLRAFENENHPMPVIFNLSSWSIERSPLVTWLVEELSNKYQVPQKIGQVWVENDRILPLLDGLDEVDLPSRNACVRTVNEYRQLHGLLPMVVCSRREEYLNLSVRLLLQRAICIKPAALRPAPV
jgi:transcriptional regulator with XRE-family HTH domain